MRLRNLQVEKESTKANKQQASKHPSLALSLLSHLPSTPPLSWCTQFEDFMEAIVRLALMVALPTDAMIAAVGAEDAGQYIMELRSNPEDLREFIQDNKRQWYQV